MRVTHKKVSVCEFRNTKTFSKVHKQSAHTVALKIYILTGRYIKLNIQSRRSKRPMKELKLIKQNRL